MSWSAKTTLTGLNVALSEVTNADADYVAANHFTEWVTLNPGEIADLQLACVFGSTGNDVYYRIIKTLDDTSEVIDTVAFTAGSIPFVASTTQYRPHTVSGCYRFRVEVRKGGTTAGSYTPNVYMRKNGVNI